MNRIKLRNSFLFAILFTLPFFSLSAQQAPAAFVELCKRPGNTELIENLLKAGADWKELTIEADDLSFFQPGERIISADIHRSYAALLMDWGMPVNIRDERGRTFLMKAADHYEPDLVLALLDPLGKNLRAKRGAADPNITDHQGKTALMYTHREDIIRILLRYGADPKIADTNGNTAMHGWYSAPGARRLLAEAGADVDAANKNGITPLMRTVWGRDIISAERQNQLINELIDLGADPHRKTPDEKNLLLIYMEHTTLINYTRELAFPPTVKLLLDLGIDPAETDDAGNSALLLAFRGNKNCPEAKEIQSMFRAAADKENVAAAKKEANRERRQEYGETVPGRLLSSAYLLIPLSYLGFSITAREILYKNNQDSNWMVPVNTFTAGFITGAAIASVPFLIWIEASHGWDRLLPVFLGIVAVPVAGIIMGGVMVNNSQARSAFQKSAGLYYIAPAIAGAITIPIFIYIWRK